MEGTRDRQAAVFWATAIAVMVYATAMTLAYQVPDWDYLCNINAAELLRQGKSPYSTEMGTRYIYPPPYAHLLRLSLSAVSPATIFVIFQTGQWLLVVGTFVLLRTLAIRLGASPLSATLIAAGATVLNLPMFYNLRHHQVNLVLLVSALLATLFPQRAAVAGLALAAGTLLKLYPALLLAPLLMFAHRRAAVWWLAGVSVPLLFSGVREDWWRFLQLLPDMPKGQAVLDNSVTSLFERGVQAVGYAPSSAAIKGAAALVGLAMLVAACRRLMRHYREGHGDDRRPFLRAMAEWSAVALFMSPIAWDMHFLLAVPLAVVLVVERPRHVLVLAGLTLMLLLPRRGDYPLSHHYLAGLSLLFASAGSRLKEDRTVSGGPAPSEP